MRTKLNILFIVLIILLLLFVNHLKNKSDRLSANLESIQLNSLLQNQKYDSVRNLNDDLVYKQKAIEIKNQSVIKKYSDSMFNMGKKYEKSIKATIAFFSSRTNTQIVKEYIPYNTSYNDYFPPQNNSDSLLSYIRDSTIRVGTKVNYQDTGKFSLSTTLGKFGLQNTSVNIPDSFYLKIDLVKGGLFKRSYYNILSYHTNPLIQNKGQNSIIYRPPKKHVFGKVILAALATFLATKYL